MFNKSTALIGRTVRFAFDEGPTAGSAYDHTFHEDGSVEFRTGGKADAKGTRVEKYGACEIAPKTHLVSYLGDSGYTLTVVFNLDSGDLRGFASNEKEWHPVGGKARIVSG